MATTTVFTCNFAFSPLSADYCFDQFVGTFVEFILDESAIFLLDEDGVRLEFE